MKILAISNLYPPLYLGGYEIECHQMVEALRERGHEVSVLTSFGEGGESEPGLYRRLRLVAPFRVKARFRPLACWWAGRHNHRATRALIEEVEPDVIHLWSQHRLSLGSARAALESGIPTLFTMGDDHMASYRAGPYAKTWKGRVKYAIERYLFPENTLANVRIPHATCISRCLFRNLKRKGVRIEEVHILHRGIPVEQFPLKNDPGELRHPVRVLYVGQLHPYKGVRNLLEAAHQVAADYSLRITVVGTGDPSYEEELKTLAREIGAAVTFTGKLPYTQLSSVYRDHDLFVFPSTWEEPQGATHLEAMASGLPVLSTLNGGQGELFKEGVHVLGFEPGDPLSLARALKRIIEEAPLRHQLVKAGRELVENELSFHTYVDAMERHLSSLCLGEIL